MAGQSSVVAEKPVSRSVTDKKNQVKVPKKIHKSEREKSKRDHLNELFLELGQTLEPTRQNNGKASILSDATKILRDLIARVESLRKENAALFTETRYVTAEKNELKNETTTLGDEVKKLQDELRERTHSNSSWCGNTNDTTMSLPPPATSAVPLQQAAMSPVVGPVYVIPLAQDLQSYPDSAPQVRRPHARYPTPSDPWPHQLLLQQEMVASRAQCSNSGTSNSTTTNCREEGSSSPRELKLL